MAVVNKVKTFDLTKILPGAEYYIKDMSEFSTYSFLVDLAAEQPFGVYNLAKNADGFSELISINCNGIPGSDVSLAVGTPLVYGNITYSLSLDQGNLQLTISRGMESGKGDAKGNFGGNSDSNSRNYIDYIYTELNEGSTTTTVGGYYSDSGKEFTGLKGTCSLIINGHGKAFTSAISGDFVADGVVTRSGEINLTINGGTYSKNVCGGMYFSPADDRITVARSGEINLTINGGTFANRVYGGNLANKNKYSTLSVVTGDINLVIDATEDDIFFGRDVVAGSFGYGQVYGDTCVTIRKASDRELSFTSDKGEVVLSGGSESALYVTSGGVREAQSYVYGNRILNIESYKGEFNGRIEMFSHINVSDNTAIEFTNASLNLSDIGNWDVEFGSSLSGIARNNFTGDTLSFDLTGFAGEDQWEVMNGNTGIFDTLGAAAAVTLGGSAAVWNGAAWENDKYSLGVSDSKDKLIITQKK